MSDALPDNGPLPPIRTLATMLVALGLPLVATTCNRESPDDARAPARTQAIPSAPAPSSPEQTPTSAPIPTLQSESEREAERAAIDPRQGDWKSEVFAEEAAAQLGRLAGTLASAQSVGAAQLETLATGEVAASELRPSALREVFAGPAKRVRRSQPPTGGESGATPLPFHGLEACAGAFGRLVAPLGPPEARHIHLKIVSVAMDGDQAETTVTYDAAGRPSAGALQQTARWTCRWRMGPDGPPLLTSIRVDAMEEVETDGGVWFGDITGLVLGENPSFREHVSRGLNHWLERVDRAYGLGYFRRHGIAVGDANGDGLDDIYLCQPGGLPNRLYLRREDGTAAEASAAFGVDWLDNTSSALFADVDNDGDQDLALTVKSRVRVLENLDNRSFLPRAALPLIDSDSLSLSSVDFDGDGDLDFYVCVGFADKNAHAETGENLPGFVFHDSRDGGRNALFRNDGNWQFADATAESGLDADNRRHSLAAAWEDYDNDGDPDLYVANDYGPNCLYRNSGGKFEEVAEASGVRDFGAGMSVTWGDYDRDGWMDLYVSNMFSYAGNRISSQPEFLGREEPGVRAVNRRFAKGNSLFRNSGQGRFTETGSGAGVERGRWAWGSLFADIDNDGWEDLFVANGYITTPDKGDL
ncbi:MAG: FG-GAP-like repeat-containing protein [Verrucomicrobiales bacterium]